MSTKNKQTIFTKIGTTEQNTNLIFELMIFTFAIMVMFPAMYFFMNSYAGVTIVITILIMGLVSAALVFFFQRKASEARIVTLISVISAEAIFAIFVILIVVNYFA